MQEGHLLPGEMWYGDVLGLDPVVVEQRRQQQRERQHLEHCTKNISEWAMSFANVTVDKSQLRVAIQADFIRLGRYPTADECEELVTGGEDGLGSELRSWATFTSTDAHLDLYYDEDEENDEENDEDEKKAQTAPK